MADTPPKDNKPPTAIPMPAPQTGTQGGGVPLPKSPMPMQSGIPNMPASGVTAKPAGTTATPIVLNAPTPNVSNNAPAATGKDFQALMKEMQNINQTRASGSAQQSPNPSPGPVPTGMMNLGPGPKMDMPKTGDAGSMMGGDDDGYYQDDYYHPPPAVSPLMKLFFAVQTFMSVVMVILLVMIFNMFSKMNTNLITAETMRTTLQSFVDGVANQNKSLMDGFLSKMDEVGISLTSLDENNNQTQATLTKISKKLDRISRAARQAARKKAATKKQTPPETNVVVPKPIAPAPPAPSASPNNLPNLPGLDNLPALPNLPVIPQSKDDIINKGQQPATLVPESFKDNFELPPLPEPTPNLFPNN